MVLPAEVHLAVAAVKNSEFGAFFTSAVSIAPFGIK